MFILVCSLHYVVSLCLRFSFFIFFLFNFILSGCITPPSSLSLLLFSYLSPSLIFLTSLALVSPRSLTSLPHLFLSSFTSVLLVPPLINTKPWWMSRRGPAHPPHHSRPRCSMQETPHLSVGVAVQVAVQFPPGPPAICRLTHPMQITTSTVTLDTAGIPTWWWEEGRLLHSGPTGVIVHVCFLQKSMSYSKEENGANVQCRVYMISAAGNNHNFLTLAHHPSVQDLGLDIPTATGQILHVNNSGKALTCYDQDQISTNITVPSLFFISLITYFVWPSF